MTTYQRPDVKLHTSNGAIKCDGCDRLNNVAWLLVAGNFYGQLWEFVLCTGCSANIAQQYEWVLKGKHIHRQITFSAMGCNFAIDEVLWKKEAIHPNDDILPGMQEVHYEPWVRYLPLP